MISGFAIPTLGILCLGAPPAAPSFAAAWYHEVIEGNVAVAAKEYEAVYLAQESEKLSPSLQQLAALRAGACFERLGLVQNAAPGYVAAMKAPRRPDDGVEDAAIRPSARLAREAAFRLRSLGIESAGISPESAGDAVTLDVTVDRAVQSGLEGLRAIEKSRAAAIAALEAGVSARTQRVAERKNAIARLETRGVVLSFPSDATLAGGGGDAWIAAIKETVPGESDFHRTQGAVRERLADEVLESIRAGSETRASSRLSLLSATVAPGASPPELSSRIASLRSSLQAGAPSAARRILDLEIERKTLLRREIYLRLDEADDAERRGRKDLAIASLDKVRDLLDWSGAALRFDPEISALSREAASHYLAFAKSREQVESLSRLWSQVRIEADRIVRLSEDLLEAAAEDARLRGPAAVGGRSDAVEFCRSEAQRLLAGAQSIPRPAIPAAQRALNEGLAILEWAPGADAAGLRAAIESALKESALAPAAAGPDAKETKSP